MWSASRSSSPPASTRYHAREGEEAEPMSVSAALGDRRTVQTPAGTIEYRERGSGPAVFFVHGVGVNGDLWRGVARRLAGTHRCVVPDLPWGSHSLPISADADLSLPGMARIVADAIAGLELEDVTLSRQRHARWPDLLSASTPSGSPDSCSPRATRSRSSRPRPSATSSWRRAHEPPCGSSRGLRSSKLVQRLPTAYGWVTLSACAT